MTTEDIETQLENECMRMYGYRRNEKGEIVAPPTPPIQLAADDLLKGGDAAMELRRFQMFGFGRGRDGHQAAITDLFSGCEIFRASQKVPHNPDGPCSCWHCTQQGLRQG